MTKKHDQFFALMEEYKSLRDSISKKMDLMYYILGFTLATIGTIITILISGSISMTGELGIAIFGLIIIDISFSLIIRLIYSIKTIGGFIQRFIEPKIFRKDYKGWENYVSELKTKKTKNFFILAGGTHVNFGIFYLFISISIVTTLCIKIYEINGFDFNKFSIFDFILASFLILLFLFLTTLIVGLNSKVKYWKPAWNLISIENGSYSDGKKQKNIIQYY